MDGFEGNTVVWNPSRHPELDAEFFNEERPWPMGDRLFLKRFGPGRSDSAWIEKVQDGRGFFRLHHGSAPGWRAESLITAETLLDDCWEVD